MLPSPSTTAPPYETLSHETKEIRLLSALPANETASNQGDDPFQLAYTLSTVPLSRAPPFTALSYVWGDPSATTEITVCGTIQRITKNLHAALTRLNQGGETGPFWIDAVCINQGDAVEKNHQIPLMRDIYSSATKVVAWLGEAAHDTPLAFSLVERWADAILSTSPSLKNWPDSLAMRRAAAAVERPFDEASWTALGSLCRNVYWERIWILQEVSLAQQCLMICGDNVLSFHKFMWISRAWVFGDLRIQGLHEALTAAIFSNDPFSTFIRVILEVADNDFRQTTEAEPRSMSRLVSDFPFLLKRGSGLAATDPRDKVYGLLGFLNVLDSLIPVEYGQNVIDVYREVAWAIAKASGRLDILTFGGGMRDNDGQRQGSSWAPDFQRNLSDKLCDHAPFLDIHYFNASGTTNGEFNRPAAEPETLNMKGVHCGEIIATTPPSSVRMDRFREWLTFTLQYQDMLNDRRAHPQQTLFRVITADHLWRGLESPDFLAPHLEAEFFRLAAVFMLMVRDVSKSKSLSHHEHQVLPGANFALDMPLKAVLETWLGQGDLGSAETRSTQAANFLRGPEESLIWPDEFDIEKEEKAQENLALFQTVLGRTDGRCLFVTESGYLGAAPRNVKPGDRVFLPLGCDVPLAIRDVAGQFELVGDVYVCGLMQGEAVQSLHEVEEIALA